MDIMTFAWVVLWLLSGLYSHCITNSWFITDCGKTNKEQFMSMTFSTPGGFGSLIGALIAFAISSEHYARTPRWKRFKFVFKPVLYMNRYDQRALHRKLGR